MINTIVYSYYKSNASIRNIIEREPVGIHYFCFLPQLDRHYYLLESRHGRAKTVTISTTSAIVLASVAAVNAPPVVALGRLFQAG